MLVNTGPGSINFVHHVYKIEKTITIQYRIKENIFTEKSLDATI